VRFPVHLPPSPHRVFPCAAITEHPYRTENPQQLTDRLRQQWLRIRTQNRHLRRTSHRPESAHIEPDVPSTRNINSDSQSTVATSVILVDRRGERNVPRRYLKDVEWYQDKYLGEGYYVADPGDDDRFCAVDFNFDTLQWGLTEPVEGQYRITRPIPVKYGLRIFDEERQDRSRWGPIDGSTEKEEPLAQIFRFGSDRGETPDPDIDISGNESREHEERALAALAQLIPTHITRPHFNSIDGLSSLAARMSQIAATTTLTSTSTLGRTAGAGVPSGGGGSASILKNFLGGGGRFGGGPPHGTGPPGGGGPADSGNPPDPAGNPDAGDPDAGGGGNPADAGGRGNPPDG
jgi:hypothetical protein